MLIDPQSNQNDLDYRNLLWALTSPPLFPEYAASVQDLNPAFRDEHQAALAHFLSRQPPTNRIGHYFENLIEFYLTHILGTPTLHAHETIKDGELDFLFLEPASQRWKHWEVALKFYFYEPENGLFWGQKRQDRLDIKKDRIIHRQLGYSKDPELADRLGIDPALIDRELLVRGRLFQPYEPKPEILQNNWWVRGLDEFFARESDLRDCRFRILERREWLADPIEFPLSYSELQQAERPSSTMLAIRLPSSRVERGFVLEKRPDILYDKIMWQDVHIRQKRI